MTMDKPRILNVNLGVLGHVDCGKTSLCKALSTVASTAAFDKNPQSKERGITLDLGFSSFSVDMPEHLRALPYDRLQFTLVDCPGHASLIRTIIGGAQIIDLMLLVVDITKGMQTQTAECLVIGEITSDKMVVVLNKVDQIPADKRPAAIEKMTQRMAKTLETTVFKGSPIVPVAAHPGADGGSPDPIGLDALLHTLLARVTAPQRDSSGPFLFSIDHCFQIKGQGSVMTGTVLQGAVGVGDTIDIPALKVAKKVKSIQMFHEPVQTIRQGDRAGVCVTQFDAKLLERGMACTENYVATAYAMICDVRPIRYFKQTVASGAKFHITVGHQTCLAEAHFFTPAPGVASPAVFTLDSEYEWAPSLPETRDPEAVYWVVLHLERPLLCPPSSLYIASRLDTDIHSNTCRLAFYGHVAMPLTKASYKQDVMPQLKVYKNKEKVGQIERVQDAHTVIGKGMFKKETDMSIFTNLKVHFSTGEVGVIEGGFGQSGKFKVAVRAGLSEPLRALYAAKGKAKEKEKAPKAGANDEDDESASATSRHDAGRIVLRYKRYVYAPTRKLIQ